MKKLFFLLLLIPLFAHSQVQTDAQIITQINSTIRGKNFDNKNTANAFKTIVDSKLNIDFLNTGVKQWSFGNKSTPVSFPVAFFGPSVTNTNNYFALDVGPSGPIEPTTDYSGTEGIAWIDIGDKDFRTASNASYLHIAARAASMEIASKFIGTGVQRPLNFAIQNTTRFSINTTGRIQAPFYTALDDQLSGALANTKYVFVGGGSGIFFQVPADKLKVTDPTLGTDQNLITALANIYASVGGGITNGAAANELMKSDGTNAVGSSIYSPSSNTIQIGTGGSSSRIVAGNAGGSDLTFVTNGGGEPFSFETSTGNAVLQPAGGATSLILSGLGTDVSTFISYSTTNSGLIVNSYTPSGGDVRLTPSGVGNYKLVLAGSNPTSGPAGDVFLTGGTSGSGNEGNVGLFTQSVANWQGMQFGFYIGNRLAAPSAGIADGVAIIAEDLAGSSELYTVSESGAKFNITGLITNVLLSGTTLTLTEAHRGAFIYCTNSSAITITVPPNLQLGFNCTILQDNATGTVSLVGSGGTTINGKTSTLGLHDKIGINYYKATDVYIGL